MDDHQLVRETWKQILHGHEGIYVIGECGSGTEAIDYIPALKPDVVLMDINMFPVNGFEATPRF